MTGLWVVVTPLVTPDAFCETTASAKSEVMPKRSNPEVRTRGVGYEVGGLARQRFRIPEDGVPRVVGVVGRLYQAGGRGVHPHASRGILMHGVEGVPGTLRAPRDHLNDPFTSHA